MGEEQIKGFKTVKKGRIYTGEIQEKKSRFISCLSCIKSEGEATEFLESVRKKHYDARHNCSAYLIKAEPGFPDILHSSDDGEPSGTAGKPIMSVIEGEGLKNVIIVVTRYFGGTLLGTGGLVRAYTESAKEAVKAAEIITISPFINVGFSFDYAKEGAVRRLLERYGVFPEETEYGERVFFGADIPLDQKNGFREQLKEILSGLEGFEERRIIMK